ncbi:predicted protein [Histoplasma capsulatum var. duboisii H88]|uniref:Predicted protein n=2 Tax=Ajellomyces capsulatus TaxID=5037 RepID=F0UBS4_AJEC8|nr:predicted protein [Histoplasma capsulatum H143]EGC43923.1 predicted protein [Histoplasma capsulatum var. duboisii H88]
MEGLFTFFFGYLLHLMGEGLCTVFPDSFVHWMGKPPSRVWEGSRDPLENACDLKRYFIFRPNRVYAAQYTVSLKAENGAFTANLGLATSAQPTFDLVTVEDGSPIELGEGSKNEQVMLANHGEDTRAYAANKSLIIVTGTCKLEKKIYLF